MKKALFLSLHRPDRSPSQRFRFEQYLQYLSENGYECMHSYLIREKDDKRFYGSGNYFWKLFILIRSVVKRIVETWGASKYDIIYVQRECFMLGTSYFEKQFAKKSKLVFDFDDSIWLQVVSEGNKSLGFLKDASKTAKLIEASHMVFAGNEYLANYAKKFNHNVKIVPTTIDTDEYQRIDLPQEDPVCIGWSGSVSTIEHFEFAIPVLKKIKEKYGDRVSIKVVGDGNYRNNELGITGLPWTKENELKDLSSMDIGLMPLPDDEWTNGKCGLKGLQYMALEIATIMSAVGVNTQIIQDGENGFLAATEEEWMDKISRLIEDEKLRKRLGKEGQKTVLEKYSVKAQEANYLKYFNHLIQSDNS